jgi:hypothetical protein
MMNRETLNYHAVGGSVPIQRRYFSESELSAYSGISKRTLQGWRLRNQGPPWVKFGGAVKYDIQRFEAWAISCQSGGPEFERDN